MKLLKETKKETGTKGEKKEQKMFEEKEMFESLQSTYQVKVFSPRICCPVCDSQIRKIKNSRRKIWSVNGMKNHFSSNNKYKENHEIDNSIHCSGSIFARSFREKLLIQKGQATQRGPWQGNIDASNSAFDKCKLSKEYKQ